MEYSDHDDDSKAIAESWAMAEKCREILDTSSEDSSSEQQCSLVRGARPVSVRLANARTRVVNGQVLAQDRHAVLLPLRNVRNGRKIPDFPETLPRLFHLHDAAIDHILYCLGGQEIMNSPGIVKVLWIVKQWAAFK